MDDMGLDKDRDGDLIDAILCAEIGGKMRQF